MRSCFGKCLARGKQLVATTMASREKMIFIREDSLRHRKMLTRMNPRMNPMMADLVMVNERNVVRIMNRRNRSGRCFGRTINRK